MKIAITSLGESLESPVDKRFGHSRYFILYDTKTEEWQPHANEQNTSASQGAGIQAARTVADLGAQAVITGHCGPKAFRTLIAFDTDVYLEAAGTVKESIEAFSLNRLTKAGAEDVNEHLDSA